MTEQSEVSSIERKWWMNGWVIGPVGICGAMTLAAGASVLTFNPDKSVDNSALSSPVPTVEPMLNSGQEQTQNPSLVSNKKPGMNCYPIENGGDVFEALGGEGTGASLKVTLYNGDDVVFNGEFGSVVNNDTLRETPMTDACVDSGKSKDYNSPKRQRHTDARTRTTFNGATVYTRKI